MKSNHHVVTLVHKGAMEMAVQAIRSFSGCFRDRYELHIHTDGSLDEDDHRVLLDAATGTPSRIITYEERREKINERLARYPLTRRLIERRGYFTKLELPMFIEPPYLYFDSDIFWLHPTDTLVPEGGPNAFSTESWSWYFGVKNDDLWLKAGTPRRVNSGFYYLGEEFPFARMEDFLERDMFNTDCYGHTDQEIMAYLYPEMVYYHPEDFKRSRREVIYDLEASKAAALHFPGQMWRDHMDQISSMEFTAQGADVKLRFQPSRRLSRLELLRMRLYLWASRSELLKFPIRSYRAIRSKI